MGTYSKKTRKTKNGALTLAIVVGLVLVAGFAINAGDSLLRETYARIGLRMFCDNCGAIHFRSYDADGFREPHCEACRSGFADEIAAGVDAHKRRLAEQRQYDQ